MCPMTLDVARDEEMDLEPESAQAGANTSEQDGGDSTVHVPLRKAIKNASAFVTIKKSDADGWLADWTWRKKVGKKDQGDSMQLGKALPGCDSKAAAVHAALTEMATSVAKVDERISEDILEFRDTEWHVAEGERTAVDQLPPPGTTSTTTPAGIALHDPDAIKAADVAAAAVRGALNAAAEAVDPVAEFKARMSDTALLLAEAALSRRDCETALKNAKAHEKELLDTLQTIQRRGPENFPLWEGGSNGQAKPKPAPPTAATVPADNSWESHLIDELGLAKGIHQKLVDAGCDTIGRLERRRAEIATGKEKWPKGVGEAAVTKIENAVIGWLTENRPGDKLEDQPATATSDQGAASEIDPEIGDVEARLATLLAEGASIDWSNGATQSGAENYERDGKLTDCPHVPGIDQDQWLLGFNASEAADE